MWIRLGYYYLKAIQQNYLKIDKTGIAGTFSRIIEFTPVYKIGTATQGFLCIIKNILISRCYQPEYN